MADLKPCDFRILHFLVLNPRLSDSAISKQAKIPIKTVARRRAFLEKEICSTFTSIDFISAGIFKGRGSFILQLKPGITQLSFMIFFGKGFRKVAPKHIAEFSVGKRDGCLSLHLTIESYRYSDLFEILNADILPDLESAFGVSCVTKIQSYTDVVSVIKHTNYLVLRDVDSGVLSVKKPYVGE
jgi:hypothetical protein